MSGCEKHRIAAPIEDILAECVQALVLEPPPQKRKAEHGS